MLAWTKSCAMLLLLSGNLPWTVIKPVSYTHLDVYKRQLQDSAPPLPPDRVHAVLTQELGPRWRRRFASFDDTPVAAASIGQVHRCLLYTSRCV